MIKLCSDQLLANGFAKMFLDIINSSSIIYYYLFIYCFAATSGDD